MSCRISLSSVAALLVALSGMARAAEPTSQPAAKGDLVELKLELPKPMFVGTPKSVPAGTTVEKSDGKPRPAFLVPKGCVNVASKKPVTASDDRPIIGTLAMLTDGNKEATEGSWVELGPGAQWAQIDLKEKCDLYAIVLWHYHAEARIYKGVVVQISDDPDFVKEVKTVFNNDHENTCGLGIGKDRQYFELAEGKIVDAKGTAGRYIRLYSNGSTADEQNQYIEVEAWGMPAKK